MNTEKDLPQFLKEEKIAAEERVIRCVGLLGEMSRCSEPACVLRTALYFP
jgi:hypothetical protein